jgi:hypothetical protein
MSGKVLYVLPWFNRSDWRELKALCASNDLQDTYDEWRANVRAGLKAQGLTENDIEKVILTPSDLRDWKAANTGEINSKVRARLAIDLSIQRKQTRH